MCFGISVSTSEIPEVLIERHGLRDRVVTRAEGAESEVQFIYTDAEHRIPES